MTRYALQLEYDGSDFHGWQIQAGVNTIQGCLEKALSNFANHPITTITAGRTDSSVHALNQVVHFESDAVRQLSGWVRGVNAALPTTIRVKEVAVVDANFNARLSATARTYHYYLLIQAYASAHLHPYVGWYHQDLNITAMQQAAQLLLGTHDFSSFRASGCQARTPYRTLTQLTIEQRGKMIRFSITANAFLQHMVRNIVGALVYVGNQRLNGDQFAAMISAADRKLAPPTFMANGLYLVDVTYPYSLFTGYTDTWLYNL